MKFLWDSMSPTIPKANLIWHVTWDITESMKRLGPKSSNSGWKKKGKRVREKDLYACLRETKRWENQRWREQEREIETERGRGGQREGVAPYLTNYYCVRHCDMFFTYIILLKYTIDSKESFVTNKKKHF